MPQRTLLITNDFPPQRGGTATFGHDLAVRICGADSGGVTVYTAQAPGAEEFDARQPFPVVRDSATTLLPTRRVARRAAELVREYSSERVVFGAAIPLGLLTRGLRAAGAREVVAVTHAHEVGWARVPVARRLLRHVGESADILGYLDEYTRAEQWRVLGPHARERLARVAPGVDPRHVASPEGGREIRVRYGLGDGPVALVACRLVPRSGVDTLIRSMAWVRARFPGARLLVVGQGPDERRLRALAAWVGVRGEVVFAGDHPRDDLARFCAAADVFATPCRSRWAGLEAEGLGVACLEAAANGLPVVVGSSGGAPEAVRHGDTGYVVDGRDPRGVARHLVLLFTDPARARAMGERGREWVAAEWAGEGAAGWFPGGK